MRHDHGLSIARLARAFEEPRSTVARWVSRRAPSPREVVRRRPVSGNTALIKRVRELALTDRHRTFGYRRIWALLRREGVRINRKTVYRIMKAEGLTRPRIWRRPKRPKRVARMRPECPNRAWQIDMTSFQLSDLRGVFLVTVIDCCTREIVGWTLDRRCRAREWTAAVRMAIESRGLDRAACRKLVLRSDNGSQPCSRAFVEYLGRVGVRGEYTGYDAPDDNAVVERVIRTIKEEEVWPNVYDTLAEARAAVAAYVHYYNEDRIHSALDYRTPTEFAAAITTLAAA